MTTTMVGVELQLERLSAALPHFFVGKRPFVIVGGRGGKRWRQVSRGELHVGLLLLRLLQHKEEKRAQRFVGR